MTYRTDDERKLIRHFLKWLFGAQDRMRAFVEGGKDESLIDEFLAQRQVEREWGKKE